MSEGYKSIEAIKPIEAKKLAELLGVSASAISFATSKDHLCQGYPVAEWAERTQRGRVIGYKVPDEVYDEIQEKWPEPGEQFIYENELDRSKNYEKKYDRETDEATGVTAFNGIKSWITMWNNRLDRIADADDKDGVMWIIDAMEETNKMMNVEQQFPDLWERFVSIRDQKFSN